MAERAEQARSALPLCFCGLYLVFMNTFTRAHYNTHEDKWISIPNIWRALLIARQVVLGFNWFLSEPKKYGFGLRISKTHGLCQVP
jgi:hypothetical protein